MSKGAAGKVGFPTYLEDMHTNWVGDGDVLANLTDIMDTALGVAGNPFEALSYTDPSTDFDAVETEFQEFDTDVDALNYSTDYGAVVDAVVAKVDEAGVLNDLDITTLTSDSESTATSELATAVSKAVDNIDESVIRNLVKNFEARTSYSRDRAIRRFSGQMADINAVQGSAYMFGLALIEAQVVQSVEDFHSQVTREQFSRNVEHHIDLFKTFLSRSVETSIRNKVVRDSMLTKDTNLMTNMLYRNINLHQVVASTLAEIKRVSTVAEAEYIGNTADLNKAFSSWDFEVFNMASPVAGALGGGTFVPKSASKASSAIGGALSGAAGGALAGAEIGAAGGPIGAGAGAAIGALGGIGAALF